MYLIVNSKLLNDQWECECDNTPIAMADDWKKWLKENYKKYDYSTVYEWNIETNTFTLVKNWSDMLEHGMAFYMFEPQDLPDTDKPTVIYERYEDFTRGDDIPSYVWNSIPQEYKENTEEIYTSLRENGYFSWLDEKTDNFYVYGEYEDNQFAIGF